jgi:hypothetical protein
LLSDGTNSANLNEACFNEGALDFGVISF